MVEVPGEDFAKEVFHETSKQGGPIAVLAIMLVAAMLTGIGVLGYFLVPVMRDYIAASTNTLNSNAKSFSELSTSMSTVHQAHASMMAATEAMQVAVLDNGHKIEDMQNIVIQMSEIVQEARTMMQGVPTQRLQQHEETLKKLQSIDDSLQQLLAEFKIKQP